MDKPRVTIAVFNESKGWRLPTDLTDALVAAAGDDAEVRAVANRAEFADLLPQTEILIGCPLTEEQARTAAVAPGGSGGRLRWLLLTGSIGDEEPVVTSALSAGVRVCSAASIRAPFIAEHALALALALTRRVDIALIAQTDQRWSAADITTRLRTLSGATVGIVATASIAREIAIRMRAFGARTLVTSPVSEPGGAEADAVSGGAEVVPFPRLRDVLSTSDVLVIAAPRVPRTLGLIGRTELALMKETAVLIDVSRGRCVQAAALIDALRRGRLGGAGLDAFEAEPLAPNSPLWSLPGVVITPHVASGGPRYWHAAVEVVGDNLRRVIEDRPPLDEVRLDWFEQGRS